MFKKAGSPEPTGSGPSNYPNPNDGKERWPARPPSLEALEVGRQEDLALSSSPRRWSIVEGARPIPMREFRDGKVPLSAFPEDQYDAYARTEPVGGVAPPPLTSVPQTGREAWRLGKALVEAFVPAGAGGDVDGLLEALARAVFRRDDRAFVGSQVLASALLTMERRSPLGLQALVHRLADESSGRLGFIDGRDGLEVLAAMAKRFGEHRLERDALRHLRGGMALSRAVVAEPGGPTLHIVGDGAYSMSMSLAQKALRAIAFAPEVAAAIEGLTVVIAPRGWLLSSSELFFRANEDPTYREFSRVVDGQFYFSPITELTGATVDSANTRLEAAGTFSAPQNVAVIHEENLFHYRDWPRGDGGTSIPGTEADVYSLPEEYFDPTPRLWTLHHEIGHSVREQFIAKLAPGDAPLMLLGLTAEELVGAKAGKDVLRRYVELRREKTSAGAVPWGSDDPDRWFADATAQYLSSDPLTGGGAAVIEEKDPELYEFLHALYGEPPQPENP